MRLLSGSIRTPTTVGVDVGVLVAVGATGVLVAVGATGVLVGVDATGVLVDVDATDVLVGVGATGVLVGVADAGVLVDVGVGEVLVGVAVCVGAASVPVAVGEIDVGVALETAAVVGDGVGVLLAKGGNVGVPGFAVAVGKGCVVGGLPDGVWVKVGRGVFVAVGFTVMPVPGNNTITCFGVPIAPVAAGVKR